MTDQEINDWINLVKFDPPKETEVVINVPLYVPKAIFPDGITGYAKFCGWRETVPNPKYNLSEFRPGEDGSPEANPDYDPAETVQNPITPMQFLSSSIRNQVKAQFQAFVQVQAAEAARKQADAKNKQLFGE